METMMQSAVCLFGAGGGKVLKNKTVFEDKDGVFLLKELREKKPYNRK